MRRKESNITGRLLLMGFILTGMTWTCAAEARGKRPALPAVAAKTIEAAFPKATIMGIGRERENGVMFYEVNLKQDGKTIEVEVSADGVIGEIESIVGLQDVPKDVADSIVKVTQGGRIKQIERHERRGVISSGRLVKLDKPKVMYEVDFNLGGKRRKTAVVSNELVTTVTLPPEARAAIQKAFPQATVEDVELEHERGRALYEVKIRHRGKNIEVEVAADGTIVEVATEVTREELPEPVAEALMELAKGAKISDLEKVHVYAAAETQTAQTVYEAEISRDAETLEVTVASDGTVLAVETEDRDDEDDEDDEDDD